MDTIAIDVELACIVGILPRERVEPQPLHVTVELELDLEGVGDTGDLTLGVDYAQVDAQVRQLCTEGHFRLIETLGLAILRTVLREPVQRARVRITKPTVMRAAVPSVELERDADWVKPGTVLVDVPEVLVRLEGGTLEIVRR